MAGQAATHAALDEEGRRLRIDTYQEAVVDMRGDCPICGSEGSRRTLKGAPRTGDKGES